MSFTTTAPSVDPAKNARVRRWDQPGTGTAGDMPLSVGTPVDIENGIQVTFTAGTYKSGDYWLIPARTASGTIDWPPCGSDGRPCQPAANIPVYTVPLALITRRALFYQRNPVDETFVNRAPVPLAPFKQRVFTRLDTVGTIFNRVIFEVEDLRSFFRPLATTALHIESISWANDDVMTLDALYANGLSLGMDSAPSSNIDSSVFRVSVEIPAYGDSQRTLAPTEFFNPIKSPGATESVPSILNVSRLRTEFALDGIVTVDNEVVSWQMQPGDSDKIAIFFGELSFFELNDLLQQAILYAPDPTWFARVRVKLFGRMIYAQGSSNSCGSSRTLFLDGQCFATAGTRQDQTPNISLQFPSGSSASASDFESWFYLAPAPAVSAVSFDPASVTLAPGTAAGTTTGTVNMTTPVSADTIVSLAPTPPAGVTLDVPASITIPAGQSSQTFTASFTVTTATVGAGVVCTVTASVSWQAGTGSSLGGSFTVIATKP
jgi:hypothetical protein